MTIIEFKQKTLPCHPCPHRASCCQNGSNLTEDEAQLIMAQFGEHVVEKLNAQQLRERFQINYPYEEVGILEQWVTTLKGERCYFWEDGCKIYHNEAYPRSCGLYPWYGADNPNYPSSDAYLCPELGLPKPVFNPQK